MTVYYITILLVFVFLSIAQNSMIKSVKLNNETIIKKTKTTKTFFVLAAAVLIFVAGFRYFVGADYGSYYRGFEGYASDFWPSLKKFDEPGIRFIAKMTDVLGGDAADFIFVCSFVTIGLFMSTIYKNTNMPLLTTILYVFMGCWHGAFNGIRQNLAAAIIFAGVGFIKERKFWKYLLVVFIAFLFHASAIIMIFPYFIAYNKINFRNIILLIIASIVILFSFSELLNLAGFILRSEIAVEYEYITNSVSALRVLVAIAPAVFFLFIYSGKSLSKEQCLCLNFLIINGVVMFATSNSTYFARMGIYSAPFSALSMPELIKGLKNREKVLFSTIIVVAFFVFWIYSLQKSYALNDFKWIFGNI